MVGSTLALSEKENNREVNFSSDSSAAGGNKEKRVVSYWGIQPSKLTKPDGIEWKWNCFRPWETYKAEIYFWKSIHWSHSHPFFHAAFMCRWQELIGTCLCWVDSLLCVR